MQVVVPEHLVDQLLPRMRAVDPTVDVIGIGADGSHARGIDSAEALFRHFAGSTVGPPQFGTAVVRTVLSEMGSLRWFHCATTGVESLLIPEVVESDIILTNDSGAHRRTIAEMVLAYILADAKTLPDHFRNQRLHKWQYVPHRKLQGRTVAVLGLGNVGLEVAALCHAVGMRVVGTKRTVQGHLPGVDEVFPAERQSECVAGADYVVVTAALTAETRGMVNRGTFEAMRQDAVLINVARGNNVDEEALLVALQSGQIRGAYLDVLAREPLPADSPFWELPNAVITPHNCAYSEDMNEETWGIFLENFRRYVNREPLMNMVDKRAGY